MSSREDSDVEVFLTSDEYARILSIQKESKKERQEFRLAKQQYQKEISKLQKVILGYEVVVKDKDTQINNLTVECLRLKKLRLANQDEIRNLKEMQLKTKEENLIRLEESVRQNKEMREKRAQDETVIEHLRGQLSRATSRNYILSNKLLETIAEMNGKNEDLANEMKDLQKEHISVSEANRQLTQELKGMEVKLTSTIHRDKFLQKEIERLELENEKMTQVCEEKEKVVQNLKLAHEAQVKNIENIMGEEIRINQQTIAKLKKQIEALKGLQLQSDKKQLELKKTKSIQRESMERKDQKMSSRVLEVLEDVRQGMLNPQDIKDQIDNILTLEKEYEDIICGDSKTIKRLEQELALLKTDNKKLDQTIIQFQRKMNQLFTFVAEQPSTNKTSNSPNILIKENQSLKQQIEELKTKLNRITYEFDESVRTFDELFNTTRAKYQKDLAGYTELQNEIEAMKFQHQDLQTGIEESIERFGEKLENMRRSNLPLNPGLILKNLRQLLPNLKY